MSRGNLVRQTSPNTMEKVETAAATTSPNLNSIASRVTSIEVGGLVGPKGYDIIVGTSQQVVDGVATHTINNFVVSINDNDRILILSGTHVLTVSIVITESGVFMEFEDRSALFDMGTTSGMTFTLSGDENRMVLKLDGANLDAFVVSGNHSKVEVWFENGNADPWDDTGIGNVITAFVI